MKVIEEFRIRASAAGSIMTEPRAKSEVLSQSAKTYAQAWLKSKIYEREKVIVSKYLEKGNINEDEAIDLAAKKLGYPMLIKNMKFKENDFFTGTPDIITGDGVIIDVKNSWDCYTFPLFEAANENDNYFYQLQIYMNLTGFLTSYLVYTLTDTPINLIEREAKSYCYNNGYEWPNNSVFQDFKKRMTFGDIDTELKIKVFKIDYDPAVIERIISKVLYIRNYLTTLKY